MYARGTSQTMNSLAEYLRGVVTEVVEELTGLWSGLAAGVLPQNLILDLGLGFAKAACRIGRSPPLTSYRARGHRLLIAGSR